jgi:Tfp pilus assembly protein PilV
MKQTSSNKRAFSVAELLISLTLMAVAILTVIGLTVTNMKVSRKATDTTTASLVAKTELERTILVGMSDAAFWDNEHTVAPYADGTVVIDNTSFDFQVFASTVMDGADPLGTSNGDTENRLKKVDIVVYWWDSESQDHQGYGRLEVHQSRLVAEENE